MTKLYVAINYNHVGKMPQDLEPKETKEWWNKFNGEFQNKYLTIKEFIGAIQSGYAYTTQHNRYRKSEQFIAAGHLALDFDTEDERSSFDYLSQDDFIASHATFLHTTPSHTEEKPRCRVVFVLDRPIVDPVKYTLLAEALVYRYGSADTKCRDCCRLFFGSKDCQVLELGNTLTLETAAQEIVAPYKAYLEKREREHQERLKTIEVLPANDTPERILQAHATSLLDKVRLAPNGEKHGVLRDISRTFGGYVGGGYYNRFDVEQWLQAAIGSNPNNVKSIHAAFDTIRQGLDYGTADPLYFEVRKREYPELERVAPPLTPEQHEQVKEIIQEIAEKEYWRGYHDGMNAEQRQQWYKHGFTDWAIDHYKLGFNYADRETGEVMNALTIPYRDDNGKVTNIEYRGEFIYYESDLIPSLFFAEKANDTVLLFDDSLEAITAYFNYGGEVTNFPTVAALPHLEITAESIEVLDSSRIIVILGPHSDVTGRGLRHLKEKAYFLRLPFTVEKMVKEQMEVKTFGRILESARKWV